MFRRYFLFSLLIIAVAFVACTDYDDDVDDLNKRIDALSQQAAAMERQLKSIEYCSDVLDSKIRIDGIRPVTISYQVEPRLQADSLCLFKDRLSFTCQSAQVVGPNTKPALEVTEVEGDSKTGVVRITAMPNGNFRATELYAIALEYRGAMATYRTAYTPVFMVTHPETIAIALVGGNDSNEQVFPVGTSLQFVPVFTPSYSTEIGVIWKSENENVATINQNGLLFAKDNGETTVTVISTDELPSTEDIDDGEKSHRHLSASYNIIVTGGYIIVKDDEKKRQEEAE